MSNDKIKKILEELQKEHDGGAKLEHSKNFLKGKSEKRNRVFENGEVYQNQRDKVVRVTNDPRIDDDEK